MQAVYGEGVTSVKAVATDSETWSLNETTDDPICLYPNPASEIVYIQGVEVDNVMIYNVLGQLIREVNNTQEIHVSRLPNEVYHLVINGRDGSRKSARMLVNH